MAALKVYMMEFLTVAKLVELLESVVVDQSVCSLVNDSVGRWVE
jgi:hypothetical protein